jgi:hypothetical protein
MQVRMDSRMIENLFDSECKLGYRVEAKLPNREGKVFKQRGRSY